MHTFCIGEIIPWLLSVVNLQWTKCCWLPIASGVPFKAFALGR